MGVILVRFVYACISPVEMALLRCADSKSARALLSLTELGTFCLGVLGLSCLPTS
ncbi:hypothetical protein CFELI_09175 [Corynebacterium felinum]|uniref:Uncharacterized protein n=1 Tax=Corynebacterium felinum TaxID=131318 RepID=A0ABU2BBU5_9CORY|nr:hypothetical protein [Corynebacterium felinum]WJY95439.1 hypothetical protein CFELI_09175 [Corynebacterium felinum]